LAHVIGVDSVGNRFVTGQAFNGSNYGFTTIKYSPTGEAFWTRSYNGPGNDGNATAIAVDRSGNVFVTGPSWNGSNYDFATIKYSTDGEPLWTRRYSGPANMDDVSLSIAVDSSGDVFVTGNSGAHPTHDYATIAYSSGGMPLWTNLYNGPGNGDDLAYAIAVDNSGSVFVTGRSTGSDGLNSYVTIKYSSSVPPPRLDFQLLSNQLVLSWTNVGFNLQSAPAIPGTFSNISGATSPYTSALTGPHQYFDLRGN